jgi:hypothetical protein
MGACQWINELPVLWTAPLVHQAKQTANPT